jgi:hypothetical protein
MSTFIALPLDFDVLKEDWNKYELSDHSILKVKIVMTTVSKAQSQTPAAQPAYTFDIQNIIVVLTNERGQPDTHNYSSAELEASVTKDDMRFTAIAQDWNEYVVDDGARIKIQPMILKVSKTSRFNSKGSPLYATQINMTVQVKPPGGFTPALSS